MADNVIQVGATVDLSELKQLTTQSDAVADAYRRLAEAQLEANNAAVVARNTLKALGTGELPAVKAVMQDYANELKQSTQANAALKVAQENVALALRGTTRELEALKEAQRAEAAAAEAAAAAAVTAAAANDKDTLSMLQYRQAAQLAGREIGITLPRALTSLAIQSEAVRGVLAAAFSGIVAIAFIGIIGSVIDKIGDLIEEHRKMSAAIQGNGEAWTALDDDVDNFADHTKLKLTEVQERIDTINKDYLAAFKDKLEIIDAQSFEKLKQEFKSLGDEAAKAFLAMEEGQFKAFLLHESASQAGIKNVADSFDLLMTQIKKAEKDKDLEGISRLIDGQIAKTEELIETDKKWAGTSATKDIISANERLLTILKDMKQAYTEVNEQTSSEKNLAALEERNRLEEEWKKVKDEQDRLLKKADEQYEHFYAQANAQEQAFTKEQNKQVDARVKNMIEGLKEQTADFDAGIEKQIVDAQGAERQQEQLIEQQFLKGKTTRQQEIAAIAKAKQDELALEIQYIRGREAIYSGFPEKVREFEKQITKIQQQSALIGSKAVTDGLKADDQQWKKVLGGIQGEFSSFTSSIISGHQTIAQSWDNLVNGMATKFIEGLERQLMQFILTEVTKDAVSSATHAKEGLRTAKSAAAHAYDATVDIPVIGPVLAPIAAATAFAAVTAFDSSAGGQWRVPQDQFQIVHQNETILPAGISGKLRSMVEGGGSMGGGDVHIHFNVSAIDGQDAGDFIKSQSRNIASVVYKELKKKGFNGG